MSHHLSHLGARSRPCMWCGGKGREPFCKRCYGLLGQDTKASMRALFAKASPRRAIKLGVRGLEELAASGVRVPERRTLHSAESEVAS